MDETDVWEDVNRRLPRRGGTRADMAMYLNLFEHKLSHDKCLSVPETQAICAYLSLNVAEFSSTVLSDLALKVKPCESVRSTLDSYELSSFHVSMGSCSGSAENSAFSKIVLLHVRQHPKEIKGTSRLGGSFSPGFVLVPVAFLLLPLFDISYDGFHNRSSGSASTYSVVTRKLFQTICQHRVFLYWQIPVRQLRKTWKLLP